MANKQFNSIDGYSVGNTISVINSIGNVTANAQITRNSRNVPTYVYQANTPPSSPLVGDQWYNITSGVLFEYLDDGTTAQWVDVNGIPGIIASSLSATANTVTNNAQPNITSVGTLTSLVMAGNITPSSTNTYSLGNTTNRWDNLWLAGNTIYLGNANIKANATSLILTNPDGGQLVVSGTGIASSNNIYNGNSNVNIATANGNVTIAAVGNTTMTITGTGVNVAGTLNTGTGNANVGNIGATNANITAMTATGNVSVGNLIGPVANGNSNVNIPSANGNVNISAVGNANIVVVTGTGANVTGTFRTTGATVLASASGNVGIGNTAPGQKLTVAGTVESTSGGFKFPDGTTQNTAAAGGGGGVTSFSGGSTGLTPNTDTTGVVTLAGTLALANGGTGANNKTNAFNNLSPTTTRGDMLYATSSNTVDRLPIGTTGYYLKAVLGEPMWVIPDFDASAITSGAVAVARGGTGLSYGPYANNQLLVGSSFGSYNLMTLTAGSGISITDSAGNLTISAVGAGTTINVLNVTTFAGNTFYNYSPNATYSKPLIGSTTSPSNYGAFCFDNASQGYLITNNPSITSIGITDSTSTFTQYNSGTDFGSSPGSFSVYDSVVSCYGLFIYSPGMQTLFADSAAAIASPSLAPTANGASSGYSSSNPRVYVSCEAINYDSGMGPTRGIAVTKSGSSYFLSFGSGDTTSFSPTVQSLQTTIDGTNSNTYYVGSDFTVGFAVNSANGMFTMNLSPSNGTLTTLLDNSFLGT